jgi:hypothetical protein
MAAFEARFRAEGESRLEEVGSRPCADRGSRIYTMNSFIPRA